MGAGMLDTIRVQYRMELPEEVYSSWDRRGNTYFISFRYREQSYHATYIPINYKDHFPMLRFQFSLPMILFGCNHLPFEVSKLKDAVPILDGLIHQFRKFSNLDSVSTVQLVRFDACANFQVGKLVPEYLAVIKKAKYGKKERNIYDDNIQFTSREETISIYDKYKKCKHPEAYGLLRLEVQIKTANLVQEILCKEFPTVLDLSKEVLDGLLQKALDTLGLSGVNICCMTEAEVIIQKAFPERKVLRKNLINYLRDTQVRTPEYIRDAYSLPTLRKYKELFRDIGISPYLVDKHIELPSLCLQQKENIFH
jgi:hypothetical protein